MVKNKDFVTGFHLKAIAVSCMVIDHIGYEFQSVLPYNFYIILRLIGRIAMPIFCFMCAEGAIKTRNFKKYALRLLLFAVISEIPFNFFVSYGENISHPKLQNVMWTLLAGILSVKIIDYCRQKDKLFYICSIIVCPIVFGMLCAIGKTDYELTGVLMIIIFYLFRENKALMAAAIFILLCPFYILYSGNSSFTIFGTVIPISTEAFGVLSLIPICLYGGKQGFYNKVVKYSFYVFYPLHIAIIAIIYRIII